MAFINYLRHHAWGFVKLPTASARDEERAAFTSQGIVAPRVVQQAEARKEGSSIVDEHLEYGGPA
jgi:hypothetical protein